MGEVKVVPEVLVTGAGALDGLAATLMRQFSNGRAAALPAVEAAGSEEEQDEDGNVVDDDVDSEPAEDGVED